MRRLWRGPHLLVVVTLAATAAAADGLIVTLSDFSLKFLSLTQAQVRGTVTCTGLGEAAPDGEYLSLEAGLQLLYPGQSFAVLPDRTWSHPKTNPDGTKAGRIFKTYVEHGMRELPATTPVCYHAALLTPLIVMDEAPACAGQRAIGDPGDEGRPYRFDKTMDFSLLRTPTSYRLLVRLEDMYFEGDAINCLYVWIVYGPFKWGQAPPLNSPLTAPLYSPAHFTGGPPPAGASGGAAGTPPGTGQATGGTAVGTGTQASGPSSAKGMRLVIAGKPYTGPAPRSINGATMVPMMPFFQASPIGMSYDRATRRLMVLGRKTVVMWVGKTTATVDGARVPLATPPVLVGSEVYLPLRFTVETIGGELQWDAASKTMGVTFPTPQL